MDALATLRRCLRVYHEQISDSSTLNCGVALYSTTYPQLKWMQQVRELIIPAGRNMAAVFEEVGEFYRQHGLQCHRWVPAAMQPVEPVEAFLLERGLVPQRFEAMVLARPAEITVNRDVRMLPARAMRQALRAMVLQDSYHRASVREAVADTMNDRLDDPQHDMFVAMLNGQPVGHAGLLQVGDAAMLENVVVAETHRRRCIGATMVAYLLALARRLAIPNVVLEVTAGNVAAIELYRRCGFDAAGGYTEFRGPPE